VVVALEHGVQILLEELEIVENPDVVEFVSRDRRLDIPRVTVKPISLTGVATKRMGGVEMTRHGQLVHAVPPLQVRTEPSF